MFIHDGNQWQQRPSSCTFIINGKQKLIPLYYKRIPANIFYKYKESIAPKEVKKIIESRPFGDDGIWISLQKTWNLTDQEEEQLKKIIEQAPNWRDKKYIVIDVRNLPGGSSQWGFNLLKALYGDEYINELEKKIYKNNYEEFRVSQSNLERQQDLLKTQKLAPESRQYFESTVNSYKKGLVDKSDFVRVSSAPRLTESSSSPASLLHARLYFLTNYSCASACLNIADIALHIPGVEHVGLPTHADTFYANMRYIPLHCNIGEFGFATSVMRNRWYRLNNKPYIPKYRFDGDIHDTEALEKWIIQLNDKLNQEKK